MLSAILEGLKSKFSERQVSPITARPLPLGFAHFKLRNVTVSYAAIPWDTLVVAHHFLVNPD
jgi:hypothetical protein